ncbi:LytTR family DNA-binding domain-containing protein [Sporosarcina siberiensis]|uniref:LytTR family DNA-binding domain-containing protein n=1 Tax=Sporosarcina siberiensis TaxID=1365606 RepID=A0ABW4SFQ0_9BACL
MRLSIKESDEHKDIEIIIHCPKIDDRLSQLIELIQQHDIHLIGKNQKRIQSIPVKDLLYIESVDNNSFLYTLTNEFESNLKLYEIEKIVKNTRFIRISKNLIVNISQIQSVRALFNGRFEALLVNGEKVIVNRHYVKSFKEKFLN